MGSTEPARHKAGYLLLQLFDLVRSSSKATKRSKHSWRRFAVADWASVCSCTATAFVSCLFLDVSIFQNNKQSGACKLPIYYIYARWTTLQAHCHDAAVLYYHYLIYK